MPSDLLEVGAAIAMFAPPLLITRAMARRNARERDARWARFTAALSAAGFVARPEATPAHYAFRGRVGDVPIAIEHFDVQHRMSNRTTTQRRLGYRVEAPSTLGKVGVYRRTRVPVAELGAMQEVSLPGDLGGFRAFAELPGDAERLQSPALLELLRRAEGFASLETTSGALVLTLVAGPSEATAALRFAELLAALQERRTPAPAPPMPHDEGWESAWFAAGCLPIVIAAVLGLPLSCAGPVHGLVSPIVCEEGTEIVAHARNKNPMQCVDRAGIDREPAHLLPWVAGMSLVYYPTVIAAALFAFGAERRRRKATAAPRTAGPSPYR